MKRTTNIIMAVTAAVSFAAACGPSGIEGPTGDGDGNPPAVEGDAYLSIVGQSSVFLEGGDQQQIVVKYHDGDGAPLAGEVSFALVGDAKGGNLSRVSGVTDAEGLVRVDVFAGAEAAFMIEASAEHADAVRWTVAVAPNPSAVPLSAIGAYELESQFDLASGLPGDIGTVVNTFIDMTDDPTDPATWLIDLALDKIGNSTVVAIASGFRPLLDGYINDLLLSLAPDFVGTVLDIGNDFGQVARKFGTVSVLTVTAGPQPDNALVGKHQLEGFVFTVDGVRHEFSMNELDLGQSKAEGVALVLEGENKLTIGAHQLPVSYGRVMLFALNHVIIPTLDPFADSVAELLLGLVDCATIGAAISEYVGIGSPATYQGACQAGIVAAGQFVEAQIIGIDDTAAALSILGDARPVDTTGDRKVDKLQGGLWEGSMLFGNVASVLAKPEQKFSGQRMTGTP